MKTPELQRILISDAEYERARESLVRFEKSVGKAIRAFMPSFIRERGPFGFEWFGVSHRPAELRFAVYCSAKDSTIPKSFTAKLKSEISRRFKVAVEFCEKMKTKVKRRMRTGRKGKNRRAPRQGVVFKIIPKNA